MAEKRSGRAKDVPYHPLVEALASDWGWEDLADGKAVWAAFDL